MPILVTSIARLTILIAHLPRGAFMMLRLEMGSTQMAITEDTFPFHAHAGLVAGLDITTPHRGGRGRHSGSRLR